MNIDREKLVGVTMPNFDIWAYNLLINSRNSEDVSAELQRMFLQGYYLGLRKCIEESNYAS